MIVTELQGISPIALIEKMVFQNPRKTSRRRVIIDQVRDVLLETIHKMASDSSPDLVIPSNGAPWLGATTRREAAIATSTAAAHAADAADDDVDDRRGDADESYEGEGHGRAARVSPSRRTGHGRRGGGLATPAPPLRLRDGDTPARTVVKRQKLARSAHAGQASVKKVYEMEAGIEPQEPQHGDDDGEEEGNDGDDGDDGENPVTPEGDGDDGNDVGEVEGSDSDDDIDDEDDVIVYPLNRVPPPPPASGAVLPASLSRPVAPAAAVGSWVSPDGPATPVVHHARIPVAPSALRRPSSSSNDVSPPSAARSGSSHPPARPSPRGRQSSLGVRFDLDPAPSPRASAARPCPSPPVVTARVASASSGSGSGSGSSSSAGAGAATASAKQQVQQQVQQQAQRLSPTAMPAVEAPRSLLDASRFSCNTAVLTLVLVHPSSTSTLPSAVASCPSVGMWFGPVEESVRRGVSETVAAALPAASGVFVLSLPPALPLEVATARVAQVRGRDRAECLRGVFLFR
jgi:hypothetical protein